MLRQHLHYSIRAFALVPLLAVSAPVQANDTFPLCDAPIQCEWNDTTQQCTGEPFCKQFTTKRQCQYNGHQFLPSCPIFLLPILDR